MTGSTDAITRGARSFVVHPFFKTPKAKQTDATAQRTPEKRLEEAVSLCDAIWLNVVGELLVHLREITPSTYIGKGKAEELRQLAEEEKIELFVFDCSLSPIQQRELEKILKAKVIDRTALILEIFGERAHTKEGELQVELAALDYQKSRLVRSWTHLERQRGGFGFLGGPGESQIESDRRVINDRIAKIKQQLETVTKTRNLHRKNRTKVPFPVVALVGYTNAGKSTLFNRLTHAEVFAADLLFATLDPTMRELRLPSGRKIILSDTVGFISELPTQLIAAFRATLEEVLQADLILHVRDIASPDTGAQKEDVHKVLKDLGIDADDKERVVEVWNKVDLMHSPDTRSVIRGLPGQPQEIPDSPDGLPGSAFKISALTGHGLEQLLARIDAFFARTQQRFAVTLPSTAGREIAWLHQHGERVETTFEDDKVHLACLLSDKHRGEWEKLFAAGASA